MDLPLMDMSPHFKSHFKPRHEGKIKKKKKSILYFVLGDQT